MNDVDVILKAADEWAGAPMALATVVSTWGSAPRPRGSHMLVHKDGRFAGSVSGGCVEGEILELAAQVIAGAPPQVKRFGVADASAWEVGLPCGGEIAVLVQPVSARGFPPELFSRIAVARAAGATLEVATDLNSGASWETTDLAEGAFINHYAPPRRLLIVGAVQIAQVLAELARPLDIAVTVADPRGRFLTAERFPGVGLDDRWPDQAVAAFAPDASAAVVTLSHDPKVDDPALIAALNAGAGFVGALGSRRSHAARRERLAAAGLSADAIDRIDGPVGLSIGAIGPAEIALSILAGVVKAWHDQG